MLTAARRALTRPLEKFLDIIGNWYFREGGVALVLPNGRWCYLGPGPQWPAVKFTSWRDIWRMLLTLSFTLTFTDAYTHGRIKRLLGLNQTEDGVLYRFLKTVAINTREPRILEWLLTFRPRPRNTGRHDQSDNIGQHYDGPPGSQHHVQWWYGAVLGPTQLYTCARYDTPGASLDDAQHAKLDDIAAKLGLVVPEMPEDWDANGRLRLLDLGCGWGYGACYLAQTYGVRVVGLTISVEQLRAARQLAQDMKVGHLVAFELINVLDLPEHVGPGRSFPELFDGLYTIGMVEHIAHSQYVELFRVMRQVLKPGAPMLVHCITNRFGGPPDPMVQRIFPGSRLGSVDQLIRAALRAGLHVVGHDNLWQHYTKTCLDWVAAHVRHREEITERLGPEFYNLRLLWLVGSAANFEVGPLQLTQLDLTNGKPSHGKFPWNRLLQAVRLLRTLGHMLTPDVASPRH